MSNTDYEPSYHVQKVFITNTVVYSKYYPAPSISIAGDILIISDRDSRTTHYGIYEGNVLVGDAERINQEVTTFDLSTLSLSAGGHQIRVKSVTESGRESPFSNSVTYVVVPKIAPCTISLSGNTLVITANDSAGIATSFLLVYANHPGTTIATIPRSGATTTYALRSADLIAGTYGLAVIGTASGYDNSDPSNTIVYHVYDISVTAVYGTKSGIEKLDEGTTGTVTITPISGYKVPQTISDLPTGVSYSGGVLTFYAITDDVRLVVTCEENHIATPVITLSGSTISWSSISHSIRYDIYADGSLAGNTTSTSYDLSTLGLSVGSHTVYIKAIAASGYMDSANSNSVTWTKTQKLTTPNITISGNVVSWGAISNASSYMIVVDSEDNTDVTATSFDLSTLTLEDGSHTVQVYAKGVSPYLDSNLSNSITYTVLSKWSTPTITLSEAVVSTPIVSGVTKYKVYDNGTYIGYVDSDNVWHGEVSE